ncbi:MAG TPA: TetR/AcrR family transcriptional regulator [Acidimicrobiia bacterium]|nr:TetR/AcrR family transcriptional regulator [Acidimicrobiia bacterium]
MPTSDPPPRRRGRRPEGDAKRALVEAAQHLLSTRPTGRLTVRDVAARAGCDVALVNYYFGSREGLLNAALDDALAEVQRVMETTTVREGSLDEQIRRLVREPILALGAKRHLPRMVIGQVLLERGPRADRYIAALGLSYLKAVESIVEDGVRSGAFRQVDARALVYSFSAIPAFFFLMAPVLERVLGEEAVSQEAVESFADAVADLVLYGLAARDAPGRTGDPPVSPPPGRRSPRA